MLKTPTAFTPLIDAQGHATYATPLNFLFRGDELLVREHDLALPDAAACAQLATAGAMHAVGLLDAAYCHTNWIERDAVPPPGHAFRKLRALFGAIDDDLMAVAGRSYQIAEWARTHRYCGACATPTERVASERCLRCPACGHVAYPRISPAMMVLVRKGDAILLARHTMSPTKRFSPLAGFLEAGESAEEAVHREVFEEVGLKVNNLRYFGTQAWPFPHSLMIAFTADYVSGEIRVDEREIAEARWFGPDDGLPEYTTGISISGLLIDANLPRR
ncbi:NAD(+) diphosphatase [Oxalobacteraceae bacterium OM1]|nr:NAD(+) diphosphatase [Oxalobacteraceae bacterium OM1]